MEKKTKLYNIFGISKKTKGKVWLGSKLGQNAKSAVTRYRAQPIKHGKKVNINNYTSLTAKLHPSEI